MIVCCHYGWVFYTTVHSWCSWDSEALTVVLCCCTGASADCKSIDWISRELGVWVTCFLGNGFRRLNTHKQDLPWLWSIEKKAYWLHILARQGDLPHDPVPIAAHVLESKRRFMNRGWWAPRLLLHWTDGTASSGLVPCYTQFNGELFTQITWPLPSLFDMV